MSGLNVYTSNRMERLVEQLAGVVAVPLSSPLVSEVIVVQSRGMERWLSIQLAARLGVWANCRFPFPNRFMWEVLRAVAGNVTDLEILNPQVNAWRIMNILPGCLDREGFESLRFYLADGQHNLKNLQLAERIADVFDAYAIYRPEQALGWDRGIENHWQAQLWRLLFRGEGSAHRAGIWRSALEILCSWQQTPPARSADDSRGRGGLPERLSIFGIPTLPRYHLEIIKALANLIPVHLFLFNPSKEYWADIVPERKIVSIERAEAGKSSSGADLHFDVGNPLLASFGRLGRDFFRAVFDLQPEPSSDFIDPGEDSLLSAIQSDILTLRNRGQDSPQTAVKSADSSLQIHACHSPWREIEILYDRLLYLFETRKGLTPKDILVMTPAIEMYAPYISAVFDACQEKSKRIPYSIADRSLPSESLVIDIFLKITGLSRSRLQASEVMDILNADIVRDRFGLAAEEIDVIHRWIFDTRIRWGIDGEHRAAFGVPPFEANSWRAGMQRLILGYALRGDDESLFLSTLPYGVEGSDAMILGKFLQFLEQLFGTVRTLDKPRALAEWGDTLDSLRSAFITETAENAGDTQLLRNELKKLLHLQELSGFEQPVEIDVVRYYLSTRFQTEKRSAGFLTGGVTFCEMLPMRSIPFRVVALIGLNNDAYPREESPVVFDLIAQDPQPGDRSLRDEDRYLFLEALLSARDVFYISYVGQSIKDNSTIPPSVLVSELIDYCEQGFSSDRSSVTDFLITQHRLQPFNFSYFDSNELLLSYSQEDLETAIARTQPHQGAPPFIAAPLKEPPPEWKHVSIQDLKTFYENPARYFLRYRFGMYLEESDRLLEGEEPFTIDRLDQYALGGLLLKRALSGQELDHYLDVVRAQGILPPGVPGDLAFADLKRRVETYAEVIKPHIATLPLAPLAVDFEIGGFRVSGRLDNIWSSGSLFYRFAKDRGKYQFGAWIDHLILNMMGNPEYPRTSRCIATDKAWRFEPVENAATIIESLLRCYWQGLSEPLRFFPESSFAFAERIKRDHDIADATSAARAKWEGSPPSVRGEGEDPYLNLCFSGTALFDGPFGEVSRMLLDPLLERRQKA